MTCLMLSTSIRCADNCAVLSTHAARSAWCRSTAQHVKHNISHGCCENPSADVDGDLHTQIVIFVKSVQRARELNKLLVECNFPSIAIHGSMSQAERLEVLRSFAFALPKEMEQNTAGGLWHTHGAC